MVADAFLAADRPLGISASIADPVAFMRLTDALLPVIEYSTDPSLAAARKIVRRIRTRDLYRFVDEILLPPGRVCTVAPHDITTCQDLSTGVNLVPDDVYVVHVPLNFGMKSKNPVDNVLFFKDWCVVLLFHFVFSCAAQRANLCAALTTDSCTAPNDIVPQYQLYTGRTNRQSTCPRQKPHTCSRSRLRRTFCEYS